MLRRAPGKHDPHGVAQLCEKHMSSHRASGFGKVAQITAEPIVGQPFQRVLD
jgi:hypothetical protein